MGTFFVSQKCIFNPGINAKMKICVAQTRSVTGEVRKNIDKHKEFTGFAVSGGADIIVFPELSLTGYEPTLANKLATNEGDDRFRDLQYLSDNQKIIIAAGIPIKKEQGVMIGMIIFRPNQPQQTYFKQYLHPDEERYFIKGTYEPVLSEYEIAMAICYEISVPLHAEQAHKNEARVYIASVAKTIAGIEKAIETLTETAKRYSMFVLLSNCVGECEGKEAGGTSSVWNNKGILLGQLDNINEGMLILDTTTQEVIVVQKEFSSAKKIS